MARRVRVLSYCQPEWAWELQLQLQVPVVQYMICFFASKCDSVDLLIFAEGIDNM